MGVIGDQVLVISNQADREVAEKVATNIRSLGKVVVIKDPSEMFFVNFFGMFSIVGTVFLESELTPGNFALKVVKDGFKTLVLIGGPLANSSKTPMGAITSLYISQTDRNNLANGKRVTTQTEVQTSGLFPSTLVVNIIAGPTAADTALAAEEWLDIHVRKRAGTLVTEGRTTQQVETKKPLEEAKGKTLTKQIAETLGIAEKDVPLVVGGGAILLLGAVFLLTRRRAPVTFVEGTPRFGAAR